MNGMNDFEKQLAQDIREIRASQDKTEEKVAEIDKKLAVHKAKSGMLGAGGGALVLALREVVDAIRASVT